MFLTPDELVELTGYHSPAWQVRWLERHGFAYKRSATGRIVLSRAYVESRMAGQQAKPQLNFDALKRRA